MPTLSDLARRRIVGWMEARHPKVTQIAMARAVGVSQSWVSYYLSGSQDADVDQLAAMAHVFGHTLFELFDLRPDPGERDLVEAYRKLRPEARTLAVALLQQMSPPAGGRGRTRGRTDE